MAAKTTSSFTSASPLHVGVFLPAPPGARWRGEGIAHTIEFILGGFEENGRMGRDVRFTFFTTPWLAPDLRTSLQETLKSLDAVKIELLPSRKTQVARTLDSIFSLGGLLRRKKKVRQIVLDDLPDNPSLEFLRKYYKHNQFLAVSKSEGRRIAAERAKSAAVREAHGTSPAAAGVTAPHPPQHKYDAQSPPGREVVTVSGMKIFNFFVRALRAIPILRRFTIPWTDAWRRRIEHDELAYLAKTTSRLRDQYGVDVWWVPQPNINAPEYLKGPVLANFWDFVIGEFGYFWDYYALDHIYNRVKLTTLAADAVLTQSFHNKDLKLCLGFDVPEERVSVCYLSGPAHYAEYVPTFAATGRKCEASRREAANIIRAYLHQRILVQYDRRSEVFHHHGNEVEKLFAFPFETATFAVVSTQNRPYKNVPFLVDCFLRLINERNLDAYLIMTTEYNLADPNDKISQVIHKRKGVGRVFCLSRIPNKVHAALYHCATATLHPSFTEGGVGAFSFMEGMTMGTPGLVGRGDYTTEGKRLHSHYDRLILDPNDPKVAMDQVFHILTEPEAMYESLLPVFEAHKRWTWADVSESYLSVLRSLAGDSRAADVPEDFFTTKKLYHSLRPLAARQSTT